VLQGEATQSRQLKRCAIDFVMLHVIRDRELRLIVNVHQLD
jgi:hypothetical protein